MNMPPMPPHLFDEIVHKALSSDTRRKILLILAKDEKYLSEIAQEVGKKPQTVDFHLNVLSEVGIVTSEWKKGKKYYTLKNKKIIEFITKRKPIPEKFRHKPPHEIVIDSMNSFSKRLDALEKKIDLLLKK
jgi:DNA-binding transcriptional ArsR family regulator